MKEMLMFYLYKNLPVAIYTCLVLVIIFLTYIIGSGQTNHVWKTNIKYHLPIVYRTELEQRDAYIDKLEAENKALRQKLDTLLPYFKAMREVEL